VVIGAGIVILEIIYSSVSIKHLGELNLPSAGGPVCNFTGFVSKLSSKWRETLSETKCSVATFLLSVQMTTAKARPPISLYRWLNQRSLGHMPYDTSRLHLGCVSRQLYSELQCVRMWNPLDTSSHQCHGGIFNFDFTKDGLVIFYTFIYLAFRQEC